MRLEEKNVSLYLSAGVVSFSAIAYELILATYATFLLGSTVFQYSLVFSLMMAAMGVGSYFAEKKELNTYKIFILSEITLSILSVISIPFLYWVFYKQTGTQSAFCILVVCFGFLIGLEIPLLNALKTTEGTVSKILFSDYIGGFVGGLLFPLFLLPKLGFFRASAILSILNLAIAIRFLYVFKTPLKSLFFKFKLILFTLTFLVVLYFFSAEAIRKYLEKLFFGILK